ncbi:MAG TPA: hypothetical protein VHF89_12220, partial [Solirubrobacteraceae bacterium]|nr:hypothetical protein [Solirubrobacteraceae bacterium]
MHEARAAAVCALALLLACPLAAAAPPPRFDPPARADARDAAGSPLDLRRVAFGQRDLRMVLRVRAARPWAAADLRGGRTLCLLLRP